MKKTIYIVLAAFLISSCAASIYGGAYQVKNIRPSKTGVYAYKYKLMALHDSLRWPHEPGRKLWWATSQKFSIGDTVYFK